MAWAAIGGYVVKESGASGVGGSASGMRLWRRALAWQSWAVWCWRGRLAWPLQRGAVQVEGGRLVECGVEVVAGWWRSLGRRRAMRWNPRWQSAMRLRGVRRLEMEWLPEPTAPKPRAACPVLLLKLFVCQSVLARRLVVVVHLRAVTAEMMARPMGAVADSVMTSACWRRVAVGGGAGRWVVVHTGPCGVQVPGGVTWAMRVSGSGSRGAMVVVLMWCWPLWGVLVMTGVVVVAGDGRG